MLRIWHNAANTHRMRAMPKAPCTIRQISSKEKGMLASHHSRTRSGSQSGSGDAGGSDGGRCGGYGTKGNPVQAVYDEDSEWIVMMMSDVTTRPRLIAVKPSGSGASASVSVGTSNQIFNDTVKYPTLYYDKSHNHH